jgi:hypothetical protein
MNQITSPIEIYQFRVVLCETSPHIWRRLLVRNDSTRLRLEWTPFLLVQHSVGDPCQVTLSDVRLYPKERFSYDEENAAGISRAWRIQIRLEKEPPLERTGPLH